jgi:hypothetical protein
MPATTASRPSAKRNAASKLRKRVTSADTDAAYETAHTPPAVDGARAPSVMIGASSRIVEHWGVADRFAQMQQLSSSMLPAANARARGQVSRDAHALRIVGRADAKTGMLGSTGARFMISGALGVSVSEASKVQP